MDKLSKTGTPAMLEGLADYQWKLSMELETNLLIF